MRVNIAIDHNFTCQSTCANTTFGPSKYYLFIRVLEVRGWFEQAISRLQRTHLATSEVSFSGEEENKYIESLTWRDLVKPILLHHKYTPGRLCHNKSTEKLGFV